MLMNKNKKEIAQRILSEPLIHKKLLIEWLTIQIESCPILGDKDNFPGNTDADVQYFKAKQDVYTEILNHVNREHDHSESLRLIFGIKAKP